MRDQFMATLNWLLKQHLLKLLRDVQDIINPVIWNITTVQSDMGKSNIWKM